MDGPSEIYYDLCFFYTWKKLRILMSIMVEAGIFLHFKLNLISPKVESIKSEYGMAFMVWLEICNSSVIHDRPFGWFSSGHATLGAAECTHVLLTNYDQPGLWPVYTICTI